MATTNTTKRTYGKERILGDIIYNPETKLVFCSLKLGFFGTKSITLEKRQDDGCYDLMVSKYNSEETIKIGQTFPVKKQDGTIVDGLTQATLGLLTQYDKDKQKYTTDNSDGLFITTHKLKEQQNIGDNGFKKLGYITGKFGIEDEANTTAENNQSQVPVNNVPEIEINEDEIPF